MQRLILKGNGGFHLFGLPNYSYLTECLADLPAAISQHSQASQQIKNHEALHDITDFFDLNFIEDETKKELVRTEIQKKSHTWAENNGPSYSYFN